MGTVRLEQRLARLEATVNPDPRTLSDEQLEQLSERLARQYPEVAQQVSAMSAEELAEVASKLRCSRFS